jgi:hypothetical protein
LFFFFLGRSDEETYGIVEVEGAHGDDAIASKSSLCARARGQSGGNLNLLRTIDDPTPTPIKETTVTCVRARVSFPFVERLRRIGGRTIIQIQVSIQTS